MPPTQYRRGALLVAGATVVLSSAGFLARWVQTDPATTLFWRSVFATLALNDVVISKGSAGSMIEFEVYVDREFVYNLRSDGVIVASGLTGEESVVAVAGAFLREGETVRRASTTTADLPSGATATKGG